MKLTYKQKLFGSILLIFALFSIFLIVSEQREQKQYKTEALETRLDGYVDIIGKYIRQENITDSAISEIRTIINTLPHDMRVTIIRSDGTVIYDKDISDINSLANHLDRPEVMKAQFQDYGTNIRMSESTNTEYLYYAKFLGNYFVRVALPYNIETRSMLQPDNFFAYVVVFLLILILIIVNYVAERFGKSITKLKDFAILVKEDKDIPAKTDFPKDELGEIGNDLVEIFKQKEEGKRNVEREREKLIQHFQYSEVGLCMFYPDRTKIYANTHFIQYLNLITNKPVFDPDMVFVEEDFKPIWDFLDKRKNTKNYFSFQLEKFGKAFSLQTIIFDDKSFEITIKDITKVEKNRLLKQEMTNNIAHELRTPVTGLRGYLETLHEQKLTQEKQQQFISRAYQQVVRLSNLIDDVSIVSKMEESPSKFTMDKINLSQLLDEVRIDLSDKIKENNISLHVNIEPSLVINGNYTLLYSIFRNLMDNSVSYAGRNIDIFVDNYLQDGEFVYFSYYDTGSGVDEIHMNRLFERFYRIHEGRTRNTGGSGLGLSIVKNAILLHHGEIQAKRHDGGGLEFLFTLKK